jgi:hypothetical protein
MSIGSHHEIQDSRLEKQLQEDAQQDVPPSAAESITLARQMGAAAANVLLDQVNAPGKSRLLALEALREAVPGVYHSLPARQRAEIYAEALGRASFFNSWGVPGYQLTDASKALIDLGEDAVAVLTPLLDDSRDAPLSGSQAATTSLMYGNRIRDYAWVLIMEATHRKYSYPQDPLERDRLIEALRYELEGKEVKDVD